jgi:hypothetical protein
MNAQTISKRRYLAVGSLGLSLILGLVYFTMVDKAHAGPFGRFWRDKNCDSCAGDDGTVGGSWYWMRSPDEEKRVVMGLYNRYCVRCHGVDGRGVWDIPGVPNFTNERWQETRSDKDIARIIIEGRGAVMPPFRGTMTLEEAHAMARYLRTFVPGTEVHRPDLTTPAKVTPKKDTPSAK